MFQFHLKKICNFTDKYFARVIFNKLFFYQDYLILKKNHIDMTVLVTGSAGFIGYHLSEKLLKNGYDIIGLDNINDYYNPKLKEDRLGNLARYKDKYTHIKCSLEDSEKITEIFNKYRPKKVVNLAAQAGVRYSIENPKAYIDSNIVGFCNILEACRNNAIDHLVYASSSSVYGGNTQPFSESNGVDHPVSLYAATKKSNELMAHVYSHLYGIPSTGLRFFTVYGPRADQIWLF